MVKTKITLADATRLLDEMVQEVGPDYVYINNEGHSAVFDEVNIECIEPVVCQYVHGTRLHNESFAPLTDMSPGCGIGRILIKLGVPMDLLAKINCDAFGSVAVMNWFVNMFDFDDDAVGIFISFQNQQDSGREYGKALTHAKRLSRVDF